MAAIDEANQARLDAAKAKAAADAKAKTDAEADAKAKADARQKRMDELEAERAKSLADKAAARAASDPMLNPTVRPEAPQNEPGYITYYSWIGGASTGRWKLYKEPVDSPKADSATERSTGGKTQATFSSAVGANFVPTANVVTDPNVKVVDPNVKVVDPNAKVVDPNTKTVDTNTKIVIPTGLDPATLAIIQGLQAQIAALTASTNKQDAAAAQAKIDAAAAAEAAKKEKAENAITVLTDRFNKYGLGSLVPKIKELALAGASEDTIALQLQETDAYKMRFKANEDRIKKGLTVLAPADYLNLEDDYRQILRAYGLKQFDNDAYVTQFISNDISTTELSNRVATAVQRVQNADPAVLTTLRSFYGISDNDLVAYVLDPNQQFQKIERQVAAAEIGAAAGIQGLSTGVAVAEQLAAQGITKAQAQKGYATIADILPTAEKLSDIYGTTLDEYRQNEAEQEVFNTLASAQRKRQSLIAREAAAFSGASGLGKSSLTKQIGGNI